MGSLESPSTGSNTALRTASWMSCECSGASFLSGVFSPCLYAQVSHMGLACLQGQDRGAGRQAPHCRAAPLAHGPSGVSSVNICPFPYPSLGDHPQ